MDAYVAPISHPQRRLWFLDRLEPGNPVYHIPVAVRLRGSLDRVAAERALATIVERHDTLRTSFALEDGEPVQVVRGALVVALPVATAAGEEELAERLTAEARRPFDLVRGPLWRALLLERAPDDHVLLLTLHHLIADGWSLGVLVREFSGAYRAAVEGSRPALPELAIQFADFVEWQNGTLAGPGPAAQLAAWRSHLGGAPTVLEWPADFPRPAEQGHRGALLARALPSAVVEPLRALGRREGATLFMTLLAAFETLLLRLTRQEEFLVGTPVAGRARSEAENLIGFFANTLVLRADLTGDPAFTELLRRARQECLGAFAREGTPFDRVVDAVQPVRDRSRTPLFQVYFTLQNAPREELRLPGLSASIVEVDTRTAKVDLTLSLEESPAGIVARWEYCTDLFAPATVARFADALDTLLAGIVANPAERISRLPIVGSGGRAALLALGGGPVADFSTDESLGGWFSRQAALTPERVAVNGGGVALTYRELDARTNQLARHLRRHGVGPDVPVGLCLGRSVELVVGILGILKAGGAYVPVDPDYPRDRIEFVLGDSGMAALVTLHAPAGITHPHQIDLAADAEAIAAESTAPPGEWVGAEHGAYVIYTSGSTGRPKGCVVTHGNVTRLMRATGGWYRFDERDVWTLFHSYAFDFSVWEIWGALLHGGRLVVVSHEVSRSPELMHQLLEREGVTVLNQTPSAFRQLQAADEARPGVELALRYVIFGGEALEPRTLLPWFDRRGDERPAMVNMYGITETTVHVTYRRIRRADAEGGRGSLIGERIGDLTLYVVDGRMEPVPVGVPGELLVGGAGLARGYLGRPELTAERFVANPFGAGRLYRSGDLARWRPDGDLEYLGRIDQQVKIRGFRIELGEIERVLAALPGVRDAVVLARDAGAGDRRLVAYLVPEAGVEISPAQAREACRRKLADYMVPAAFVLLERLPLTSNGKLDRRALPDADAGSAAKADYVPPASPAELALAGIWARVLGVAGVGAQDNFFALGGDSILTIQVVSLAAKAGWQLSARDLFGAGTLAELAALARPVAAAVPGPAPVGASAAEDVSYPLSPMQSGMLFQSVYAPGSGVYVEQVWGDLEGDLRLEEFRAAWDGLLGRNPGLCSRFHWRDVPEPRQETVPGLRMPWQELDWSGAQAPADPESAWSGLLERDRSTGFDFAVPPLMRVVLVRLGPSRWRWLWSHHHILLDGWCLPLVFREVLRDYERRRGAPIAAPVPGRPYRDYIAWLAGRDAGLAEGFWRRALAGFGGAPELRLPRPSPPLVQSGPGEAERRLTAAESEALRGWARQRGLTLNTLFQGAWAVLLQRLGLGRDVVFGVTVSGRPAELAGVESMIGLFINTLPLRVAVAPGAAVVPWLKALQQAQAEARQFEATPLVSIQGWSEAGRGRPLFESILVFENYPGEEALREVESSLRFTGLRTREQTNFPLTAAVIPGQRLELRLAYDAVRFGADAMERLLALWHRLVMGLTSPAVGCLADLDPLGAAERRELVEWGRAVEPDYRPETLLALLARQAEGAPSAPALLAPDRELSYAELWHRSGQIAGELRHRGVGQADCVALCLDKSPELVVAMVGILRAGAYFLPIDPQFARERLAGLLEDARPALLLVDEAGEPHLRLAGATPHWRVEPGFGTGASRAVALPVVTPLDLAYLIYTSGSTGRPKGVLVEHAGLANLARTQAAITRVAPGQRILQFASISFDASVSEVFMALAGGAALWLEPRGVVPSPGEFAQQLRRARIDHATLPPALLAVLSPKDFPGLRTLLMAGEAAAPELYRAWSVDRTLFNAYGPTETSVCATMEEVRPGADDVTLGRPIANLTAHVVDADGDLQPVGVPGEIWVGGAGVARGYLGRPDLTAERFVPDPRAAAPGARAYRTGDLGRVRPDGRIEFLGRADGQVKIRGFRVEPGEIEAALALQAEIAGALVVALTDAGGARFLVAYAVARPGSTPDPVALRAHLGQRLPDYMVPRQVIVLPAWPLTASGKVDRRALPPPPLPPAAPVPAGVPAEPPAAGVEAVLGAIWRDVLHVPMPGLDDNFFELGGDSILSLQIVARAHQAGYGLTPRQIFAAPTIRGQAAVATRIEGQGESDDEAGELPLTPIQHWFFAQHQPDAHHWNQSIVLELLTAPPADRVARALAAVVARHGAFRLRFRRSAAGTWTQAYGAPDPAPELPVHPAGQLEQVAARLQASLGLERGPLWRAAYFTGEGREPPRLFLAIHHLAVDGVSWRTLAVDLAAACAQAEAGTAIALPPPKASFGAWARALAVRAQSGECRAELPHWRGLAGAAAALPRDFPDCAEARAVAAMETVAVELDADATRSLLREAAAAYRLRADELLLAALASTLADWTGRAASVISLENHGRGALGDALDLSRTVGWFTSLYPFRLEVPGGAGPRELLLAVKEALRAVPRDGTGFGLLSHLSEDPEVRREMAGLPQAELCFNYLGQTDHTLGPEAPFGLLDVPAGAALSPRGHRVHLIDINALVAEGRLKVRWLYSTRVHHRVTITRLADQFLANVRALLMHCLAPGSGAPTPSDFTHVRLEANELEALLEDLAGPDPR